MKPRRQSGATHSFRLTRGAADIVDRLSYPRKLGGKSKLISEAITFYFAEGDRESLSELKASRQWWMDRYHALLEQDVDEDAALPPHWWHRLWQKVKDVLRKRRF